MNKSEGNMKRISFLACFVLAVYSANIFSAVCDQYEFHYDSTLGKNQYSYILRTENYEHTSTFRLDPKNVVEENIPGNITGFSLLIMDADKNSLAHCVYGLEGAVMQNPGESVSCPSLKIKIVKQGQNKTLCQYYIPSSY